MPGVAGNGRLGSITPSAIEMSNIDLAQEFVKMITTQRAFQANSRVITTSDEILSELMNIKR
jgi:flagellar hook protein FlgE